MWALTGVMCAAVVALLIWAIPMVRAQNSYRNLSNEVREDKEATEETPEATTPSEPIIREEQVLPTVPTAPPRETEPQPLPQYLPLEEENSDFFGWVEIEGTKINYPVMYAPNDLEKYLHTDFYGKYYYGGTPYLDVRCDENSENYLIYGHNMLDGSMFRGLLKYQEINYWKSHPTVRFDTLFEEGEYEVVAAFYDRVYYAEEDCFKFYNVIDLEDPEAYAEAIENFREKSIYDTGVVPEYGTQLITLITCAYHTDNGRFVLVASEKTE